MSQNNEVTELIADIREQIVFLQELGVENLAVDLGSGQTSIVGSAAKPAPTNTRDEPTKFPNIPKPYIKPPPKRGSRMGSLPSLTERKISIQDNAAVQSPLLDLTSTEQSEANATAIGANAVTAQIPAESSTVLTSDDSIEQIRLDIGDCVRCPLHAGRTQIVHTTGNMRAELMFVGEAPGADEDAQGLPFVGRAGKLLTQIIEAIGFQRGDVAIGNINRCRPPANRQPTLPEAHTCRPFLLREIAVIGPTVIVVLGNTAMHNLLDTKVGITKMRGQFHDYHNVQVMPTFHPAYLLRDPSKKREVWEDMKMVRAYLAENPRK